ncbi:MAG: beta-ketoacyl-ACP synthase II [Verrucomicrobia bacterium]|nr:beta-ketoacyl-ACP synthase II [Verrucomicrobiota bacterium]
MTKKRVVITGMGLVSCFGQDIETFYQNLLAGKSGVKEITSFSVADLPTRFGAPVEDFNAEAYLEKKQARRVDPCIAYAMGAGKQAIAHAKLDLDKIDKQRAGILLGSGMGGMRVFVDGVETMVEKGSKWVTPFFVPYILTNMPGALLGIELGFQGPNYSISTACATSNYSIYSAAEHIRKGDADIMLTGGVEASMNEMCYAGFSSLRALSRNNENVEGASRPWDKNRDGFVMGEGCAIFVLESLEHALARGATILAEYKGGSVTCDAHHMTEPRPDGRGVAHCIELALKDADLEPKDIDYINAHATSTPVGDLCEIRAIKTVFKDTLPRLRVNATKSIIGHALGGAGALELVATIQAIQTGKIHPTINVQEPEEELSGIDIVKDKAQDFVVNHAISNSFGFGGHNSVIAISRYA